MFKDMRDLMKASKQFERPGLRESLSQANEMVQQVQQNQLLVETGVDATATVAALRETGQYINEQPVIEMNLSVDRGGFISKVTHRQAIPPTMVSLPGSLALVNRPLPCALAMAVPKKRTSSARRDKRRATHTGRVTHTNECPRCHSPRLPHRVCPVCGTYAGREVISHEIGEADSSPAAEPAE